MAPRSTSAPTPDHDPTVLRAIAHPLRSRILSEVAARRSARAADIARELHIPANQASFHLRQLAKYGLVEEAPEKARDRRDRVWRVTAPQGLNVDLGRLATAPGGDAAVRVFRQQASARVHELVERAFRHEDEGDARVTLTDMALRLSPAEASALAAELHDVADRWRDRTRDDEGTARGGTGQEGTAQEGTGQEGTGPEGAARRTYALLFLLLPYADPTAPPERSAAGS